MKYKEDIEDKDKVTWKVILRDRETNQPIAWVLVSKLEYPTKEEAMEYLRDAYESEKGIPVREIFEKIRMRQMPYRMMTDYVDKDRKKKSTKPKPKRKVIKKKKGCGCK